MGDKELAGLVCCDRDEPLLVVLDQERSHRSDAVVEGRWKQAMSDELLDLVLEARAARAAELGEPARITLGRRPGGEERPRQD